LHLQGHRLRREGEVYEPIVPQHGCFASTVLGLDMMVRAERLRFCSGDAELPGAEDLVGRLEGFVDELENRVATAELRAREEADRAREEAERADDAEAALKQALAELERLKRDKL
jgi:hypothetical protein